MPGTIPTFNAALTRNLRTFAVLCAALAAPMGAMPVQAKATTQPGAQQSEKRKIIRSWQNYFRALSALECEWVLKGSFPGEPDEQNTFRYKFLWNKGRFRQDTEFSSTKEREPTDFTSMVLSFDGQFYRSLQTSRSGGRTFSLIASPVKPINTYDTIPPVLNAFLFLFEEDKDPITFETLQKDDFWQRFEKRIVEIKRGPWQGRQGNWLLIEDPVYAERKQIFVDDATHLPLFFKGISQYEGEGKDDTSDEAYDSQVTQTMKWRAGSATYTFPLKIVTRGWIKEVVNGTTKRTTTQLVQEVTAPVKINQPLAAKRFQIEIPAGAVVHYQPQAKPKLARLTPFRYDPQGGSLWAQNNRAAYRRATQVAIYDEKAEGKAQIAQALRQAKATNRRVLLLFGANWCGPCRKLSNLMKANSEIARRLSDDYIAVKINMGVEHNAELEKQYLGPGQTGIPFIVVLEADGQRLAGPTNESLSTSNEVNAAYDPKKITAFLDQWKAE